MSEIRAVIEAAIREIMSQQNKPIPELQSESRLVKDLGFSSLDLAQIVSILEMELDRDPFSEDASIADIRTIADLEKAYGP